MKKIFLLISVVILLATTGCVYEDHEHGWHHRYHREYDGYTEWPTYPEAGVDIRIHGEH